MTRYLRVRVYEEQWGGFTADYVRYFENYKQIAEFTKATGFRAEIIGQVELG